MNSCLIKLGEQNTRISHAERVVGSVFLWPVNHNYTTVKILKIGTPEIITVIVLQLEQLDFTV